MNRSRPELHVLYYRARGKLWCGFFGSIHRTDPFWIMLHIYLPGHHIEIVYENSRRFTP